MRLYPQRQKERMRSGTRQKKVAGFSTWAVLPHWGWEAAKAKKKRESRWHLKVAPFRRCELRQRGRQWGERLSAEPRRWFLAAFSRVDVVES
jgi:hypothetical protein